MRNIWKGIILIFSIIGIIVIVFLDNRNNPASKQKTLYFTLDEETISTWEQDNTFYLFLPSYADIDDVKLCSYSDKFTVTGTDRYIKHGSSLRGLPTDQDIKCVFGKHGNPFVLYIMQSKNVSTIFVETDSGDITEILSDKEHKENGKICVFTEEGTKDYSGGLDYIKGRGNYSFNSYEKKPFTLSLKNAASLLKLPAGENYVLVSNASDPTLIRNQIVREMETRLDMLYTETGKFVDLYINGEYLGNYYLCDKVEIGTERVNITNLEEQMDYIYDKCDYECFDEYITDSKKGWYLDTLPNDITGGYLVEREFEDRYKTEYADNPSSFITSGQEHFIVKSPAYCSKEQIDYIYDCFNDAETAILSENGYHNESNKKYTEYIDLDSFVKKYLVEEVSKNYDAGVSSSFFYKDSDTVNEKIYAGPGWDYDMTFGNYLDWMEYFSENPEGISRLSIHDFSTSWFDTLYDKEEFNVLLKDYYIKKVSPYLDNLLEEGLLKYQNELQDSAAMDYARWQQQYQDNPYFISREKSFEELSDFIQKRKNFLDSVWVEDKEYHIVKFMKEDNVFEVRYIEDGQAVGKLPVIDADEFSAWYNEQTNQKATRNTKISTETVFTLR